MSETIYTASPSPHIRSNITVKTIMRDVIIALMPALIVGIYFFKMNAVLVILTSVVSSVFAEWLWEKLTHKRITIGDLSAVVTGLLLAFNLPPTIPLWMVIVGAFFSIIVVKQFFGGIGQNFVNPALAGRAFLLASYSTAMTKWTVDGVTTATPLAILKTGKGTLPPITDLLIGNIGGCIGEISAIAILIGAAYLFYKKIISWEIPVTYIGTVLILTLLFGRNGFYEIFAGGLMLGAFFMATDYTTSPVTSKGKIIFGIGCGILTAVIRRFGPNPEGVSYSILIMNLFVPLIDRKTAPRIFGEVK
ncbi:MAG TPA: Na+-transporting NADH:ubiquinone oxidoreductase subunit D [Clostridiaceae bacterium]|mgnify:FL=1|jgi:electron transport complex protein RnfD|nr:Na+-transporting NADH:ubiquinone oxidoreductase subunit D [Clostridiaceae bacterium]HBG39416.1 Na+-transporting NADH:ubiquinone oxidoreductase subunit D [Clostridiaceae bacterium]HBN28575.1 Na+-transporting NADH:ubiquinone oxidoreductase subunit D [Clostridiaceae bacterium]HBX48670.1 Na+-transporting NADH:ubiquinone oxidoreductase subunit D [Clostridiaceae bacterium]